MLACPASSVCDTIPIENRPRFSALNLRSSPQESTDTLKSKPMVNRCKEGWIVPDQNYLNMGKLSFNSVDGVIIDIEQGTFQIMVSADERIGPLCDSHDIEEIVIKGLSYSLFSLDQPDFELDYHPFQLMRFSPQSLHNSRYLSTLLAADYLLKMITTDTEVIPESTNYPLSLMNDKACP